MKEAPMTDQTPTLDAKPAAQAEPFVPTKAEDYPVDRDMELTLPSGAQVLVHRPSKYDLMRHGKFPKDVAAAVRQAAEEGAEPSFEVRMKSLDFLLCETYVKPKLSMTPKADHICVHDLPDPDREFVIAVLSLSVF
jgi:hypothetical protein